MSDQNSKLEQSELNKGRSMVKRNMLEKNNTNEIVKGVEILVMWMRRDVQERN